MTYKDTNNNFLNAIFDRRFKNIYQNQKNELFVAKIFNSIISVIQNCAFVV